MKISNWTMLMVVAFSVACHGLKDKSELRVTDKTLDAVDKPDASAPVRPKENVAELYVPGTDKIYFVGDKKVARVEAATRPVLLPEATRRLVIGNPAEGDLSLQPALMQREMAEELARSREINRQNRAFMTQMMSTTKDLMQAMEQLKEYNRNLVEKLDRLQSATAEKSREPAEKSEPGDDDEKF